MSRPLSSERLQRITRVSRHVATAFAVIMCAMVALFAYLAFGDLRWLMGHPWVAKTGFDVARLTALNQICAFAAMTIASGPYFWAMYELRRMFRAFAAGEILTLASVVHFRRFALGLTLGVLSSPVGAALLSLSLSIGAPEGQRWLSISFGSESVLSGMLGVAMIVVGWVLGEAVAAADENRSFV